MSLGYSFKKVLGILGFLVIFIAQASIAQSTGSLRGTVRDRISNEELPGANVIIRGTSIGAATDLDGKFIIRNVPSGQQAVVISYIGYIEKSTAIPESYEPE